MSVGGWLRESSSKVFVCAVATELCCAPLASASGQTAFANGLCTYLTKFNCYSPLSNPLLSLPPFAIVIESSLQGSLE